MPVDCKALGRRIHSLRKRRGVSQSSLSETINKTPSYLSYIETGKKSMSLETFVEIANALNVTADDLLRDSLENTVIIMSSSFSDLLTDCSDYEKRVMLEIATAVKAALRANRSHYVRPK